MRKISNARSSRRAPGLKDTDYDHEIALVDNAAEAPTPQPLSPELQQGGDTGAADDGVLEQSQAANTAQTETLSKNTTAVSSVSDTEPQVGPSLRRKKSSGSVETVSTGRSASSASTSKSKKIKASLKRSSLRGPKSRSKTEIPRVEVQEPTPLNKPQVPTPRTPRHRTQPETAIDVLYENQRGGLLCGIKLFSPKALGQLDPPAWTNIAHKPSPTNIHTAQVPDPSWKWAWPEWHINQDDGVDPEGWEYSFMFARTFSWHKARWYNSFVRRRAWTRKRVSMRQGIDEDAADPHMLNTEYFTVRPSSMDTMRTGGSGNNNIKTGSSSRHSRASMSISSFLGVDGKMRPVEDIDTLMAVLSRSRIDREKIEAVENFLDHGEEELAHLQHKMHDIMAMFVFQASRRALLSRLNEVFADAQGELKQHDTGRLQRRTNNLKAAIHHADEECQRLEYWSDIRKIVNEGETNAATDDKCGG